MKIGQWNLPLLCMTPLLCRNSVEAFQQPIVNWNHHGQHYDSPTSLLYSSPQDTSLIENGDDATPASRRNFLTSALTSGIATAGVTFFAPTNQQQTAWASYIDPAQTPQEITNRVYLDVQIGNDKTPKRITMGLFGKAMPKTVENFVALCESNSYAGTTFYRVLSEMTVQGGAIGDTSGLGKFGTSSFTDGKPFEPDNFNLQHTQKGLVSMVRGLSGAVDSRFFIQIKDDSGWADDRYAVFGIVQDGFDTVVQKIEKVDVKPPSNRPKVDVVIVKSGVIPMATQDIDGSSS